MAKAFAVERAIPSFRSSKATSIFSMLISFRRDDCFSWLSEASYIFRFPSPKISKV